MYSSPHCLPSENFSKYSQPLTGPKVAFSLADCSEPSYQVPPLPADLTPRFGSYWNLPIFLIPNEV